VTLQPLVQVPERLAHLGTAIARRTAEARYVNGSRHPAHEGMSGGSTGQKVHGDSADALSAPLAE